MTCEATLDVKLIVTSLTVPPERMMEILPFTPNLRWSLGEPIGKTSLRYKHHGVGLALPREVGIDLERVVLRLLDRLEPVKEAFVRAATSEMLNCELSCAAYCKDRPICNLAPQTIRRMADLGLAFDLDLY